MGLMLVAAQPSMLTVAHNPSLSRRSASRLPSLSRAAIEPPVVDIRGARNHPPLHFTSVPTKSQEVDELPAGSNAPKKT